VTVHQFSEIGGWVNGIAHHKTAKFNWGMAVPSGVMGVVMHTMVGNLPGTDELFMNSTREASAHFGIGQDGTTIQWVSIRGGIAWHAVNANPNWYGIEHADNGNPGNALTEAQIDASAQLVELLSRSTVGRFALQVSNSTGTEGYGVHYMGGTAWGGHSCPQLANGSGPRAGQRAEIIRRAKIIRQHGQYPAPASEEDDATMYIPLSNPADKAHIPVWEGAAALGLARAYQHATLALAGEDGVVVQVDMHGPSGSTSKAYTLSAQQRVIADPGDLANVDVVHLQRADTLTGSSASAVLNRW
jgi:hypothetical protein